MSDAIRKQVSEFLAVHGFTYAATYVGETDRDGWKCDAWRVSFKRGAGTGINTGIPGVKLETDYFTGTGHRKQVLPMPAPAYRKGTLAYEQWERTAFKPQTPDAAGVLHSLLMDADALDQSFADWCDAFGYDSDSIKARNTYDACCAIGQQMRKLFTVAQRDELREMLQDY